MWYFGENGLIKKAEQAKDVHEQKTEKEQDDLDSLEQYIITAKWDLSKVTAVRSEDNIVVPVPIGYTASTVTGEKSVATGFVIKEGTDGSLTEGINEFVWVPVSDISDLYDSTNNAGQLWDFGTSSSPKNPAEKRTYPTTQNSGYREPDVVTGASSGSDSSSGSKLDAESTYLQQAGLSSTATVADFKTQLQNEFTTMKNSVERYGGFYIGRYETGNLRQATAVVQKNNSDIGSRSWYTMYKLSKTIKANNNVVSSMIWGCQWDATLRWMQTSSNTEVVKYVTNSTGKGNYAGTQGQVIPTGSNTAYAVNNIYDMAGNVYEWTLEANGTNRRVIRGGYYYYHGFSDPASDRDDYNPATNSSTVGSRVTLYVAL